MSKDLTQCEIETIELANAALVVARDSLQGNEAFQHAFVLGSLYNHIMACGRDYVVNIDGDDAAIMVQWSKGSEFIWYSLITPPDLETWRERVANNPQGSFERLAASRGITVEQLNEHRDQITELNANNMFPDFFSVDNGDIVFVREGTYEVTIGDGPHKAVFFPAGHRITEQLLSITDEYDNPISVHPVVHRRVI